MTKYSMTPGTRIRNRRKELGLSQDQLGEKVGVAQTTVSGWERGIIKTMRDWQRVADALEFDREEFLQHLTEAAFDLGDDLQRLHPDIREAMGTNRKSTPNLNLVINEPIVGARDVPVFGRAVGGADGRYEFNGEVMGYETRPVQLLGVKNGYAVYADGDSMFPRYKPGETIWVNPNLPLLIGDDVVVQVKADNDFDPPFGFLKEYAGRRGSHHVFLQYNPPKEIKMPVDMVETIHKVVFASRG